MLQCYGGVCFLTHVTCTWSQKQAYTPPPTVFVVAATDLWTAPLLHFCSVCYPQLCPFSTCINATFLHSNICWMNVNGAEKTALKLFVLTWLEGGFSFFFVPEWWAPFPSLVSVLCLVFLISTWTQDVTRNHIRLEKHWKTKRKAKNKK